MKIELKGVRGLACYQTYLSAIFFLPATSTYADTKLSREEVIANFKQSDIERKKLILCELFSVYHFSERDALSLVCVHKDANGVAYGAANVGNLPMDKLMGLIIESMLHCSLASDKLFF